MEKEKTKISLASPFSGGIILQAVILTVAFSSFSLVDEISHKLAVENDVAPTSTSILGPFWTPNTPFRDNGDSIILSPHSGEVTLMHGTVTDSETKKPIANVVVDIWQASSNGKYDFQDPENQVPSNLRGKFRTDENGKYQLYCLRPTAYSLPTEGEFSFSHPILILTLIILAIMWVKRGSLIMWLSILE